MSIVAPKHTFVHSIPIQRRLREIMKEKGGAFTISALSSRIGINRETLRKMLTGEREIYSFELEKFAKELHLSIDRILQEDVKKLVAELDSLLEDNSDLNRAKELAEQFLAIAIGVTERCEANIRMGKVFFESQEYEMAHQYRQEAHRLAKIVKESYEDSSLFDLTTRHLMTSFTVGGDYTNAFALVKEARSVLDDNPKRLGEVYYTLAMIAYSAKRYRETRDQLLLSLDYFRKSQDTKEIGKALHNVAFIEYKLNNYEEARKLFEQSIETLQGYPKNKLIAMKDFAKVLHQLGESAEAIRLINEGINDPVVSQIPNLEAKFRLLRSIYMEQVNEAMYVLESPNVSNNLKLTACKILMDYYTNNGDSEMVMKYYIIARNFTISEDGAYGEVDL